MSRRLVIAAPGRPEIVAVADPPLEDGRFRVETLASGISAGTEITFIRGTNPALDRTWDPEVGLFRPAPPLSPYPVLTLGYMSVGRVTASRAPGVAEGDVVAMTYGHADGHVADPARERVVRLPEGLDPVLGIYAAHMGPICANGILHADAEALGPSVGALGDGVRGRAVLVTGAGVVGLLTALFARHLGAADVVVADPTPARLAVAAALGLPTVDTAAEDLGEWAKARWVHGPRDHGADVVLQCRGQPAVLHAALRALRPQASVVDLAFYPAGAPELRLGEEFHHNGLAIRCAQIGRVPRGLADRWDRDRLSAATLDLLTARGADLRRHLVTDLVPFAEAPQFLLDVAARRRATVQAVLTFDAVR